MSGWITTEHGEAPWIGVRAGWHRYGDDPLEHLVRLTPADLETHGLVLGATGSGKTTFLHQLIAQDLARGHSLIILDYRGDLVSSALELCASCVHPSRVKVIDLREKVRPFGFNPLSGAGEPYFRALGVLDAVAAESDSWGVQLAEFLRNSLLLLAECGGSLLDLERLFYDEAFLDSCIDETSSDVLQAFWERFASLSVEKRSALASPVLNKVSPLLSTASLQKMLGHQAPFDLGRHLNTPGSVLLVSLAADETHSAGKMLGNLVLASICREIFARVGMSEPSRNPVRLIVDEFEHFNVREFEHLLAEGRRFKLSLILANQVLAQLSPRVRAMILGNVGFKAVFRTGRDDTTVLSKDIFGDAKTYDFSNLTTGYALFWQRARGSIEVEVNEPLLRHIGALSQTAAAYRNAVFAHAGESNLQRWRQPVANHSRQYREPKRLAFPHPDLPKQLPKPAEVRTGLVVNLEDWLCG